MVTAKSSATWVTAPASRIFFQRLSHNFFSTGWRLAVFFRRLSRNLFWLAANSAAYGSSTIEELLWMCDDDNCKCFFFCNPSNKQLQMYNHSCSHRRPILSPKWGKINVSYLVKIDWWHLLRVAFYLAAVYLISVLVMWSCNTNIWVAKIVRNNLEYWSTHSDTTYIVIGDITMFYSNLGSLITLTCIW